MSCVWKKQCPVFSQDNKPEHQSPFLLVKIGEGRERGSGADGKIGKKYFSALTAEKIVFTCHGPRCSGFVPWNVSWCSIGTPDPTGCWVK